MASRLNCADAASGTWLRSAGGLRAFAGAAAKPVTLDWLVAPVRRHAGLYRGGNDHELLLDNGLIRRTFRTAPNGATVGFDNLMTGTSILRAVKPEATVTLDGHRFDIGGLIGQPENAYLLPKWVEGLKSDPAAFQCVGFETGKTRARLPWKPRRHCANATWPPPGVSLTFEYRAPAGPYRGMAVAVHYELYDGLPLLSKWLTVRNGTARPVTIDRFTGEVLAAVEAESVVDTRPTNTWRLPALLVTSDYSFHGMDATTASRTTEWLPDPRYTSQVNYNLKTPCRVVSRPPIGPGMQLQAGQTFESFRTFELVYDSADRERQGLAVRRMYRALAPWVTENPLMLHLTRSDPASFRRAVDQCTAVGFEMVIFSFGSGINMENEDPGYLAQIKAEVDYAHSKGIEVGAYSLLASRRIDDADDVISPKTGRPDDGAIFGASPCLCSRWGEEYFRKLKHFIAATGLDLLEHDGSYPGDVCASTHHPGHRGLEDSQWQQWQVITRFYQWCRGRDIYLNVPDFYFLSGSNKTGMGYRETDWSLPRDRQIIIARQNIFDGTWGKTPSMGWMFVPLVQYHGGGAAATLEPLREHLAAYGALLADNLGAGVQACYRGPRLYDSPATEALVKKWVAWFKHHRAILESDVLHLRRADGRDLDGLLHVNPRLRECGLAMLYNPLDHEVRRTLKLPLYYTGLRRKARIREEDARPRTYPLDRGYNARVPVTVPARGCAWLVIERR